MLGLTILQLQLSSHSFSSRLLHSLPAMGTLQVIHNIDLATDCLLHSLSKSLSWKIQIFC